MNPWSTDPCWQNFSSLYREVVAAQEAPNEIGKFHHLTSSLYFGIASLEAFINQKMRMHLAKSADEEQIFKVLREGRIMDKLRKWPKEILSETPAVSAEAMAMLRLFNEIRGDLTHPKKDGHDIYRRLETVDPDSVLIAVAEYIVRFYEVDGEVFPYWLFGWNYLNPRPDTHEIIVINNQQFLHSLLTMGFRVPAWEAGAADQWKEKNMSSFAGYLEIKQAIESIGHCEPKNDRFPYQPKLCRRWWTEEHHRSCGHVTKEAIQKAIEYDG
jgi:hypothetical protein